MCNKKNPIRARKSRAPLNPARKSRTKTRKPKYLSLKLQLSTQNQTETNHKQKPINVMPRKQQLINLFPLHPESQVQEHEDQVFDHVAFLFETATDDASTSLHAILDSATTSDEGSPQSPSQTYGYRWEEQQEGSSLVRSAMKSCKERDVSEERWVSYWEVVEKKEQEEVSSNCSAVVNALEKKMSMKGDDHHHDHRKTRGLVGLKLDYEEIMNAWSDKRPLYIQGQSPQTVPDLLDAPNGLVDGLGSVWEVPELSSIKMKEKEDNKSAQREASVLRYKEKRQSRLFSKRIRYQVRKLNADKRPRLKGRFIKRNGEE